MENNFKEGQRLKAVTIEANVEISPRVHLITWKRKDDFLPGQVVKIALNRNEDPRIYSLCSSNRGDEMTVLFNVKEEGSLTPRMAALGAGDIIYVSAPYGTFTDDETPAWWIATGTGIAPFYSMFRSGSGIHKTLVHGVRFLHQFYFGEELQKGLGNRYIRCCSGEEADGVFHGRLTAFLEQQESFPVNTRFFLCGNPLMVVEARDILIARGVPWSDIVAEIYF